MPGRVLACAFTGNLWRCRVLVEGAEWLVEAHPSATVPEPGTSSCWLRATRPADLPRRWAALPRF